MEATATSPSPSPLLPQRVQTLADDATLADLPSSYIQPPSLRPHTHPHPPCLAIPTVDLSSPNPTPDVRRACSDWGAFHVVNHGVPGSLLDGMRTAGGGFFRSAMEEKVRYACDIAAGPACQGYGSRMLAKEDTVLDWRDYFDHHTLPESRRDPNKWPDFIPQL